MAVLAPVNPLPPTLAEKLKRIGSVPLDRIPSIPAPGTATEEDVLHEPGGNKRLYELVDGILIEKPMGHFEARLATVLIWFLESYLTERDLGILYGADATLRLRPGLVRLPDVAFVSWRQLPNRELPAEPIASLVPDLAIEVVSKGNTCAEMELKLREYFAAGTRLVWYVYPDTQTVRVYTDSTAFTEIGPDGVLDGADVLPGFHLAVRDLFDRAGRRAS
jgi:Uma2 family endonuclease